MASTMELLPAPVGPDSTNRSASAKSTVTGSRKDAKPSSSRRVGRTGSLLELGIGDLLEQLAEQGGQVGVRRPGPR